MQHSVFRSVRSGPPFDAPLWAVAGVGAFAMLLAFAAFQRLQLL